VLAAFRRSGAPVLMTIFRNEGRWDTSNVLFDGTRIVRHDKRAPTPDMQHIDYGLGIFTRQVLADRSPKVAFDLADVYADFAASGRLAGYEVTQRFYEVGTPEGVAATDAYLRKAKR
jgi:N-acetyl-alpha-D-muramate 1-phosphate uridylyltransferase